MKIETTKEELLKLFGEQFDRCGVPLGARVLRDIQGQSAEEALITIISCAYSTGFLWARHQCGTHPDYVIQPEKEATNA